MTARPAHKYPPLAPLRHGPLATRSVLTFFAGTFALSWSLGILMVVFIDQIEAIFGPMGYTNPVFILVVYSPGFVGLFMVWRHYGLRGLASMLRRLTLWRMSAGLVAAPFGWHACGVLRRRDHHRQRG